MCTHLPDFEIVRVLVVVLLDLWQLPCLPIMVMPVVDQVANLNQAMFVANQNVWQSSSEHQCAESVLVVEPMQAHQPSLHYHGEGQYSTCYRWQVDGLFAARCSPEFLCQSTVVFHEPPDWACRQHLDFRPIAVDRADNAWHQESEKSFLHVPTWILV